MPASEGDPGPSEPVKNEGGADVQNLFLHMLYYKFMKKWGSWPRGRPVQRPWDRKEIFLLATLHGFPAFNGNLDSHPTQYIISQSGSWIVVNLEFFTALLVFLKIITTPIRVCVHSCISLSDQ